MFVLAFTNPDFLIFFVSLTYGRLDFHNDPLKHILACLQAQSRYLKLSEIRKQINIHLLLQAIANIGGERLYIYFLLKKKSAITANNVIMLLVFIFSFTMILCLLESTQRSFISLQSVYCFLLS